MAKKPCSGCLERNLPKAERKLHGSSRKSLREDAKNRPPIDKTMVVYIHKDSQRLVGKVTEQDYGLQHYGCVVIMATVDAKGDKRVLKATQETLALVAT